MGGLDTWSWNVDNWYVVKDATETPKPAKPRFRVRLTGASKAELGDAFDVVDTDDLALALEALMGGITDGQSVSFKARRA